MSSYINNYQWGILGPGKQYAWSGRVVHISYCLTCYVVIKHTTLNKEPSSFWSLLYHIWAILNSEFQTSWHKQFLRQALYNCMFFFHKLLSTGSIPWHKIKFLLQAEGFFSSLHCLWALSLAVSKHPISLQHKYIMKDLSINTTSI